jgi:hypothetical protein
VAPIIVVCAVGLGWCFLQQRILHAKADGYQAALVELTSKALRFSIIFVFTVFPMVSTTIFQVCQNWKCRAF